MSEQIGPIAVLGAGTMGHGIAQCFASIGAAVRLYDVDLPRAEKGRAQIRAVLDKVVAKGKMAAERADGIVGLVNPTADVATAVTGARWVIEAAPEDMQLKVDLLGKVKAAAPADAILGSNTSSLSITELGARVGAADRVIGLHFFNPPPVMELLEIVRGVSTSAATIAAAESMAKAIGKTSILVNDAPGFATSRLGVILGCEAMRMLESGVAGVVDIDRAMELGYRHPMGPLKLTDLVGLDVRLAILDHLTREIGEQFRAPPILRRLVRAGHLGKKTGRGFYVWTPEGPRLPMAGE
ncbi:MAG: 3-hydroxyacyl-CoA dehydrogenase family protein [Myxococcales bacterium]|nr:3-hydroxyacyl-CoA dehydrogenase family protein [Myxococcales bacterium]